MLFIAEIGINHNGDIDRALQLMRVAKNAGADVVKFQKRNPKKCIPVAKWHEMRETPWGKMTYLEYKERMELSACDYRMIDDYCRKLGILWTASVWDYDSFEFINSYNVPFIKIPSAKTGSVFMQEVSLATDKPLMYSLGMMNHKDVLTILDKYNTSRYTALICNSSYPSSEDELDVRTMHTIKTAYPDVTIGYSGHEQGVLPSIVATAAGAEVIERHITMDKRLWGTDQAMSLEPSELTQLIQDLRRVEVILGSSATTCYPSEESKMTAQK